MLRPPKSAPSGIERKPAAGRNGARTAPVEAVAAPCARASASSRAFSSGWLVAAVVVAFVLEAAVILVCRVAQCAVADGGRDAGRHFARQV